MKRLLHVALWLLTALTASAHIPRFTLELTPGAHQLTATARHPSGLFTTNASVWFTNSVGNLTETNSFDPAGNVTQRIWKNPNGTTNRLQTFTWDARGRLFKFADRLIQRSNTVALATNGVDFTATYDPFGRLLRTAEIVLTNSLALTNQPIVVDHTYDPQVEFLEVAVTENGRTTWKLMGPDMDGRYGGQNGTGGFEAIIPGPELFCPIISDAFGNLHAVYDQTHGSLTWYQSRITGYGAVAGYRPVPLGQAGVDLGAKYAWRNRAQTSIGYVWMGATWLKPDVGETLSFDPYGYASSDTGHTPFRGNPVGYSWDADGRITKVTVGWASDQVYGAGALLANVGLELAGAGLDVVGAGFGNPYLGNDARNLAQYYRNNSAPAAQAGLYDASNPSIQTASFGLALATMRPGMAPGSISTGELMGARSADTIAEGWRISPYRVTTAGETFPRFESSQFPSRISANGGVAPGTFAGGRAADSTLGSYGASVNYNLPRPDIIRDVQYTLTPPQGTWIIGPRPVAGGIGNEVVFPFGAPPGSATGPLPVAPRY